MQVTYAIVLVFDGSRKVWRDGLSASDIPSAIESLDYSGDWLLFYVTRNGQRIAF